MVDKSKLRFINTRYTIKEAMDFIVEESELLGLRERTIKDYCTHMRYLTKLCKIKYCDEITRKEIIKYVNHPFEKPKISDQTKNVRLKCIRSVLNRFVEHRFLDDNPAKSIKLKVDYEVKKGITEQGMLKLLNSMDYDNPIELRDATVYLLIFENGVRIGTVSKLECGMVDINNKLIRYSGRTMKNHKPLTLPISDDLCLLLSHFIDHKEDNDLVFTTSKGRPLTSNVICKRTPIYRERTGIKEITPHAIRRGFAKRLLDKGVNIAIISKALNHQSLETTTMYLDIQNKEVVEQLKKIMF